MRLAGVASCYRYQGPFDSRLFACVNQEDLPWWAVSVLGWLSCYRAIAEGHGQTGKAYQQILERVMSGKTPYRATNRKTGKTWNVSGPSALYAIYEDYVEALD